MTEGRPWWERHRAVLQEEEADLENLADGPVVLDEDLLARAQVRKYQLSHTLDGETFDLEITFADQHPYFRPEVTAKQRLGVHQHPFSGQLCLFEGDTWLWDSSETAAAMILDQLPRVLADRPTDDPGRDQADANSNGTGSASQRTHVEPFVNYYDCTPGTAVRVSDTTAALAEADAGTMLLALDHGGRPEVVRGAVLELCDSAGKRLWSAPDYVAHLYNERPRIHGRWVRLATRPPDDGAEAVLTAIGRVDSAAFSFDEQSIGADCRLGIVAGVFEDSLRPNEVGDAWIFVVRGHGQRPANSPSSRGRGGGRTMPPRPQVGPYLARAYRSDRRSMTERIPSLAPLADKHVVMFGTGGVGAPAAIEFAKASLGTLTLVECDSLDPGNAPRWPLGYQYAGLPKNGALGDFIRWNWPHMTVQVVGGKVGTPRVDGTGEPEWEALASLIDGADLLIDATAEIGVTYYLSDLAREHGLPLVVVSTTEGGWGGRIMHLGTGNDDPCWYCILRHTDDGTLPVPPHDPNPATGNVHPVGCTAPTFTATGFDVASVALGAVRLAVSVLAGSTHGSYPPADWNVAIYEFRNATTTLPGSATSFRVARHPSCESCILRASG